MGLFVCFFVNWSRGRSFADSFSKKQWDVRSYHRATMKTMVDATPWNGGLIHRDRQEEFCSCSESKKTLRGADTPDAFGSEKYILDGSILYCLYLGIGDGSSNSLRPGECNEFVVFTCKQGKHATKRDSIVAPQNILCSGFDEANTPHIRECKAIERTLQIMAYI